MAAVLNTARLSAQQACRRAPGYASRRGFRAATCDRSAHNFIMPALSPTMSEGNIANWQLKEGDSFSAGDVLLEIETDKATMDVEAQDNGILVKIMQFAGSKGVKVGERIAVTADPGDDIASLEIPQEDTKSRSTETSKDSSAAQQKSPNKSSSKGSPKAEPARSTASSEEGRGQQQAASSGKTKKQEYPLFPSVEHLLYQNGLSAKDANSIRATGPGGRLLKGDVLAHLGKINQDYPSTLSARMDKLSHLDLSNIQIIAKAAAQPEKSFAPAAEPEAPAETEVAVPISLSAVIATQKRVQDSLGIFLPLSTFIARASELANEELPVSQGHKPTADDLFNAVLGLDRLARVSRGRYTPEISGISPMPPRPQARSTRKPDIIDMLASPPARKAAPLSPTDLGISAGDNIFSVTAEAGDEARATMYLERMKMALEKEPGRLVL